MQSIGRQRTARPYATDNFALKKGEWVNVQVGTAWYVEYTWQEIPGVLTSFDSEAEAEAFAIENNGRIVKSEPMYRRAFVPA